MEIHQIRYMCAVAETGSFTRAAAREHVAQPSLSQQIIKLEDELGAKLFHRFHNKVRPTEFGKAFYTRALDILRAVSSVKSEIHDMAGMARGLVRIGVIPTIAPYLLPKILPPFSKKFPEIHITVNEDITPVLIQKLQETTIDMAIVALPIQGAELVRQELLWEKLYAVVPSDHALGQGDSTCGLKDILSEPFLLLKEGHCFRDTVIAACKRVKVAPNIVFESGQFPTILGMVAAGMGVSIVPEMAVEPRAGCKFVLIEDERARRRVGVVRLQNHFRSRPQREFMTYLSGYISQSAGE
jgi:LysR family transcriptional regulator, hydrogen peroxide-inducible genes activator